MGLRACARCDPRDPWERERENERGRAREGERGRERGSDRESERVLPIVLERLKERLTRTPCPYSQSHQFSKASSLWAMEQTR